MPKEDYLNLNQEGASLQIVADGLLKELPNLNFKNNTEVLDWLCRLQPTTNFMGVNIPRETILKTFNDNGFVSIMSSDKNWNPEGDDEDKVARDIIAHSLASLGEKKSLGIIHPMLIKFRDDWKEKFKK